MLSYDDTILEHGIGLALTSRWKRDPELIEAEPLLREELARRGIPFVNVEQVNASFLGDFYGTDGEITGNRFRAIDYRFNMEKALAWANLPDVRERFSVASLGYFDLEAPVRQMLKTEVYADRTDHIVEQYRKAFYFLKNAFPDARSGGGTEWSVWNVPDHFGTTYEGELVPLAMELSWLWGGANYIHRSENINAWRRELITHSKRSAWMSHIAVGRPLLPFLNAAEINGDGYLLSDSQWQETLERLSGLHDSPVPHATGFIYWMSDLNAPLDYHIEKIEQLRNFANTGSILGDHLSD